LARGGGKINKKSRGRLVEYKSFRKVQSNRSVLLSVSIPTRIIIREIKTGERNVANPIISKKIKSLLSIKKFITLTLIKILKPVREIMLTFLNKFSMAIFLIVYVLAQR
jgi:hypothetical protein